MPAPNGTELSDSQVKYVKGLRTRLRLADVSARLRAGGIQALWLGVVLAGAGVPLNEALDGPSWVGPLLGFGVVTAAGIERMFSRMTPSAVALDQLRRGLARERRMYLAQTGSYAESATSFGEYTQRSELLIEDYDRTMIEFAKTTVRDSD